MPHSISRRHFNKTLLLSAAGLAVAQRALSAPAPKAPALGAQTSLDNAAAVKAAGGSWVGLSVAGWLDPDGPEAAFAVKLEQLENAPLPVLACNSFIRRRDLKCTGPQANHKEVMEYCGRAFKRAQRANVTKFTFGSSGARSLPEGFDYQRGIEQFVSLLKAMEPVAADYGITVGIEQLQSRECNFITRISEVEQVVRETDHPNVRGIADFYHMAAEGDTPQDLAKCADVLSHVEIAELEGRRIPGANGQDFRPYLKVLKDSGYKGAIGVEGRWEVSELPMGFAEIAKQWQEV